MKEKFNETTNYVIVLSILTFIVGLTMSFFPVESIATIGTIAAIYFIAHGCVLIYLDFKADKYHIPVDGMFSGIISILMGLVLLFYPVETPAIFAMVVGIWIILSSINLIKTASKLSKTKLPWGRMLALGILDLILGILVVFNPFSSMISLTLFAGIIIMVHSVINIVDMVIIKKDVKNFSDELKKKVKEITK